MAETMTTTHTPEAPDAAATPGAPETAPQQPVDRQRVVAAIDQLAQTGRGYSDKAELLNAFPADAENTPLTDTQKGMFGYIGSEAHLIQAKSTIDMVAFERSTVAFPIGDGVDPKSEEAKTQVKTAKVNYIIEDMLALAAAETDPAKKNLAAERVAILRAYLNILAGETKATGTEVRDYVANINNTDPEALKKSKGALDAAANENNIEAQAIFLIKNYFPADKQYYSPETGQGGIVNMVNLSKDLARWQSLPVTAEQSGQPAPSSPEAAQPVRSLEEVEKELNDYRKNTAKAIAKRENRKRTPYGLLEGDINNGAVAHRRFYNYSNAAYEMFALKNNAMPAGPDRLERLLTFVKEEARQLERAVNDKRRTIRDISKEEHSIIPDLEKAIEWAKKEPTHLYTEQELFNELQASVYVGFEAFIKAQRTSGLRKLGRAGLDKIFGRGRK